MHRPRISPARRQVQPARRRVVRIGVVGAGVVLAHAVIWSAVSEHLKHRITSWLVDHPRIAIDDGPDRMRRGGYPLFWRWTLEAPGLATDLAVGRLQLDTRSVSVDLWPYQPTGMRLGATGILGWLDSVSGRWRFSARKWFGRLTDSMISFAVDGIDVPGLATATRADGTLTRKSVKMLKTVVYALEIDGVVPTRVAGTEPATVNLRGRISGDPGRGSIEDLAAWRDAGGVVEVDALEIILPPGRLLVAATLTLDQQMRPLASGVIRIRDHEAWLATLTRTRQISESQAMAARIAILLLVRPDSETGEPVLELPLAIRNGLVRAGPFELGRIGSVSR